MILLEPYWTVPPHNILLLLISIGSLIICRSFFFFSFFNSKLSLEIPVLWRSTKVEQHTHTVTPYLFIMFWKKNLFVPLLFDWLLSLTKNKNLSTICELKYDIYCSFIEKFTVKIKDKFIWILISEKCQGWRGYNFLKGG